MPPSRRDAKSPTPPTSPEPPYYIAEQPLFIGGNQFARAHNRGDHVLPEHVETYGWADKVRPPDGYESPKQQTSDEPETSDSGQATSEGKDA